MSAMAKKGLTVNLILTLTMNVILIVDTRNKPALQIFRELRRVLLQMHDGIPTKIGWD